MSDFELMLMRKKEERRGRRRRRDIDIINDNDDLIAHMLQQMRLAADEDRELNKRNQPAVRKVRGGKRVGREGSSRKRTKAIVTSSVCRRCRC